MDVPESSRGTKLLLVVAALVKDATGQILLTRRPQGVHLAGHWEFPGGKVQVGETPEAALIREMREETGLIVSDLVPWTFVSHPYPEFHLLMPVFHCRQWHGVPQPLDVAEVGWFAVNALARLPMPPADLPLVERLRSS